MRMHVELDGALVAEVDEIAGPRRRSAFVRDAVDRRCRQYVLRPASGVLRDGGHEWGDDPAAWVRRQRSGDPRRVG